MFARTVLCKCTTHTSVIMCSGTAQLLRSHIGSKWQNTFNYRFVSILFIFIWPPSSQRGDLELFSGCTCELLHHCLEPISHQLADLCRHFKVEEMKEFAI